MSSKLEAQQATVLRMALRLRTVAGEVFALTRGRGVASPENIERCRELIRGVCLEGLRSGGQPEDRRGLEQWSEIVRRQARTLLEEA